MLPEKHSSDDLRIDFGTIPKHVEIRDLTLIRNGLFDYTLSLDKAAKIYSRRRQIQRFDARPGCMVLQTSGNDGYIVADPELFSSSLKFSGISPGLLFAVPVAAILIWFALSDLCIAWISGIVRCAAEKTLEFWKRVLASERNRAILKKANILIMDDATSALDLQTEARLYDALAQEHAGMTKIIIAQRIASIKEADRIAVLENGKIAALGTHEELLANSEIYQDIYQSQLREGGNDE